MIYLLNSFILERNYLISKMEDFEEELYNETINGTGIYYEDRIPMALVIIEESVLFLIGIIGIAVNLGLAVCIIKFKQMQNRLNVFLCHICITNVFTYFFNSSTFSILLGLFDLRYSYTFFCFVYVHITTFINLSSALMFIISLDSTFTKRSSRCCKITLISIWICTVIYSMAKTLTCKVIYLDMVFAICDFLTFLVLNLMIIIRSIIHVVHLIRKKTTDESNYRHIICAVYVGALILSILNVFVSQAFYKILVLHLISKWLYNLYFFQPLLYVYILTKYDENVKMCLKNLVTCNYHFIDASIRYNSGLDEVETLPNAEITMSTNNPVVMENGRTDS